MTREEFIKYVESFNKKAGEYTEEEFFQIGCAHKQLPKEAKSWSDLAILVGWRSSGESYRGFVNSRLKREGILAKKPTSSNTDDESFSNKMEALFKERQKTRDEWTAYRRAMREDARVDSLKEVIASTVSKLNAVEPVKFDGDFLSYSSDLEAVLMISDLHIGVDCDNFYNKYNVEVARERVQKLINETIKYCNTFHIHKLNVVNLGDLVHGIIHTSARIEQGVDVIDQVMIASEILATALNQLQHSAPVVTYRSCIDNHSRVIADKHQAIEEENLSRLIDWYLEERLKGTSVIFENDNIDLGMGKFELLNGKKIMFAHGHQDTINTAFQHFVGATREYIDYVLLAHWHTEKMKTYQGLKVYVNGSIVGTEQYALSKRLFSEPCQTLLIFNDNDVINISINLK